MSENEKKETPELDIPGLLALKAFERPRPDYTEKRVQNIMREVRTAYKRPSLLLFPDKSAGRAFTQPRYGIAALFIIFLGLQLLESPIPRTQERAPDLTEPEELAVSALSTNQPVALPGIAPVYEPVGKDLTTFVKYSK